MGKRLLTNHIILRSTAGRRANQSFSKGVHRLADSWDLETNSLDEDELPLRLFIRCFIPRKMEHDEEIPIVCVKTRTTSIGNKSLLSALVDAALSSLFPIQQSQPALGV